MMIAAAAALTGKTRGSGGGGARETRRGFIEVIPEGLPNGLFQKNYMDSIVE
jgi:hypothetical protein